jgi:hypothetical protein
MKSSVRRIRHTAFALVMAGALWFGATQAFATPSEQPARVTDCSTCSQQCAEIALCYTGYCRCA